MQHPFALEISDLPSHLLGQDVVEELGDNETESISGGLSIYTIEGKEEGDGCYYPLPVICKEPPTYTTDAIGEEGGDCKPITKALCEDGGPIATTLALGEEGGDCDYIQ